MGSIGESGSSKAGQRLLRGGQPPDAIMESAEARCIVKGVAASAWELMTPEGLAAADSDSLPLFSKPAALESAPAPKTHNSACMHRLPVYAVPFQIR